MTMSLVELDVQSHFPPILLDVSIFSPFFLSLLLHLSHFTYFLKFHQELLSLSMDVELDYIHFNTIKSKAETILTTLSAQIPS